MDDGNLIPIAQWYERFADIEAPGQSEVYEDWARGVAGDREVLTRLETLPRPKRQPNLLFACSRLLGCPIAPFAQWREWLLPNWDAVAAEMLVRRTQTNEPRRCALLLPALSLIDGPIALLEVGASAGLCLSPEKYSYRYTREGGEVVVLDPADGPSSVTLECAVTGPAPLPTRMPDIVWRAGIDLNPLEVTDPDAVTWLETLIWPEQQERLARIRAAIEITRADPPTIHEGDAVEELLRVAARAPTGATLVVVTSAAIVYLMPEPRAQFIELVRGLGDRGARWISNEGRGIVPAVAAQVEGAVAPGLGEFLLALDERVLAWTGPHGQRLDWM